MIQGQTFSSALGMVQPGVIVTYGKTNDSSFRCGEWTSHLPNQETVKHAVCEEQGCGRSATEILIGIGGKPRPHNKRDLSTFERIAKEQEEWEKELPEETQAHLKRNKNATFREHIRMQRELFDQLPKELQEAIELPDVPEDDEPVGMIFPRRDLYFPGLTELQLEELRLAGLDPSPPTWNLGGLAGLVSAISFPAGGKKGPNIGLTGLSPQKQSLAITKMFDRLSNRLMAASKAGKNSGLLRPAEANIIVALGMTAYYVAKTILESKPTSEVIKADNVYAVIDAWIYACAVELYWYLRTLKITDEANTALSVTPEVLTYHLSECLGSAELAKHLQELGKLFEDWFQEYGFAPNQFIPRQALMFAYRLAYRGNDLADQLERDPPEYFMFMIGMQQLRVSAVELIEKLGQIRI